MMTTTSPVPADVRRAQLIAAALASVAADASEVCARTTADLQIGPGLYSAAYAVVASKWGTLPEVVHLAHTASAAPGRLAYVAHMAVEQADEDLFALCEEYCRRLLVSQGRLPAPSAQQGRDDAVFH